MRVRPRHRRFAAAIIACAAAPLAAPATAQTTGDPIIVTGTLLRSEGEAAIAPVEVITQEELARQGSPTLLDLTRRLPSSAGVLGDASQYDPRSQFNQGLASINLRGLGPQRTLVLLNGRRLAASGAGNVPLVDVNLLPAHALERIEILKDGAAATYGSDAIAGVVNFITRTDQQGLLASGDYRYIDGSDGDWSGALSWGGEMGAARLFVSAGYQHRSELRVTDRDYASRPYSENPQGGWSGGGNPGNFDFNGPVGGIAFVADRGCEALGGFRSLPGSSADLCFANFTGFANLIEPEDRYQVFVDAEFDLGPQTDLRLTALVGRTDTVLNTSPSFLPTIAPSANAAFGGTGLFTNPAYAPALADYCARYPAAGCALDASGVPQAGALAFPVRFRPFLAGGNPLFEKGRAAALDRYSQATRLAAELDHAFDNGWELTAGLTYARYFRRFEVGDAFVDLLQNALAGFGGPDCAFASPAARAGLSASELAARAGTGGCTFFNPFSTATARNVITGETNPQFAGNGSPIGLSNAPGAGLVNDLATIDHFYNVYDRTARTSQSVADLVLTGSSGLTLPGGEVELALGAQYRRDGYARTYEGGNNLDLFPCPGSVLNRQAACDPQPGALGFIGGGRDFSVNSDVWALFAEALVPVTRRITAQLAVRYEDYGGEVGATFDPQARVRVELADWLTARGGVGTTFRGPPPQNTAADLVALTFIGGAFRAIDVLANPALEPESATTWNAGLAAVRGGFRASVDYWRYDLSGAIESEPVSGIVTALFGASGRANCGNPAFAGLEARFTFSGGVCGAANVQRLATFAFNAADVSTSGIDLAAGYDLAAGRGLQVQAGMKASYVIDYQVGDTVVEGITVQPAFDAAGLLNFGTTAYPLPQVKGQAWVEGAWSGWGGDHSLRFQLNHVGSYRDQRAGLFGPERSALAGAIVAEGEKIAAFTTLDAVWRLALAHRTTVTLALFNLLGEEPPFARMDYNFDPFTADALGFTAKLALTRAF